MFSNPIWSACDHDPHGCRGSTAARPPSLSRPAASQAPRKQLAKQLLGGLLLLLIAAVWLRFAGELQSCPRAVTACQPGVHRCAHFCAASFWDPSTSNTWPAQARVQGSCCQHHQRLIHWQLPCSQSLAAACTQLHAVQRQQAMQAARCPPCSSQHAKVKQEVASCC